MTVYVLYREEEYSLGAPAKVLGVFRDSPDRTGFEAAKIRASLEGDVPAVPDDAPWQWTEAGDGLAAAWSFESPNGRTYLIEPHIVEPLPAPEPQPRRRRRAADNGDGKAQGAAIRSRNTRQG